MTGKHNRHKRESRRQVRTEVRNAMARGDWDRAEAAARTSPEMTGCWGCSADTSRVRWKLKNAKAPFSTWRREAENWIAGLKHSEQYAARLGIDIRYEHHTAAKLLAYWRGRIGACRPEGCERYFLVWKKNAALDGKELPYFVEYAPRMKVPPLCAMRKLGLVVEGG